MVFSILGFMATEQGVHISKVAESGKDPQASNTLHTHKHTHADILGNKVKHPFNLSYCSGPEAGLAEQLQGTAVPASLGLGHMDPQAQYTPTLQGPHGMSIFMSVQKKRGAFQGLIGTCD